MKRVTQHSVVLPIAAMCAAAVQFGASAETELATNIDRTTAGTEVSDSGCYVAASFRTDADTHDLSTATLLLANVVPGTVQLELRADAGLEPGDLIAGFTSPASFSATLAEAEFVADAGVRLSPNTTYWIVLAPESGQFEWAWTEDSSGAGPGFITDWASHDHGLGEWWFHDRYPIQMAVGVDADPCPADLDDDGEVGFSDVLIVLTGWGPCPECAGDLDDDGVIGFADLLSVLTVWGAC